MVEERKGPENPGEKESICLTEKPERAWIRESHSPQDTWELARALGKRAQKGQIYCLDGDLGAGKTIFAQGFAAGLGIPEPVNSPTFTILQQYEGGRLPLYHFDVYRISDVSEMEEIGYEDCFYGDGVCLMEWSQLVPEILPDPVIRVRIEKDLEQGFDYRRILVEGENP